MFEMFWVDLCVVSGVVCHTEMLENRKISDWLWESIQTALLQ